MSTMAPISHESALWKAWQIYATGDDYANTRTWAMSPSAVDGSLWAAFQAGWEAAVQLITPPEPIDPTR